jgi:hypothetical protein
MVISFWLVGLVAAVPRAFADQGGADTVRVVVEIGKRDVYEDSRIGLRALRRNASFSTVDIDRLSRERPAFVCSARRSSTRRSRSMSLHTVRVSSLSTDVWPELALSCVQIYLYDR